MFHGKSFSSRERKHQFLQAGPLVEAQNLPRHFQPSAVRKNFAEEELPQKPGEWRPFVISFDLPPRRLHQLSILDARRAGSFASATIQAEVDVPHEALAQRQPARFHLNHLVDAPARRIHFQAKLAISRAGIQTKAAANAPGVVRPARGFAGTVPAALGLDFW